MTEAARSAPTPAARPAQGVPAIALVGVDKDFNSRSETVAAVQGLDLQIEQGEFFSLLGPSGCGKTTTLRMIAGFEAPSRGRILLYGDDVTAVAPNHRDVNMVFQNYALFPHMNVEDNIAFGLRRKGLDKRETATRVRDALELVELTGRERRRPKELSGGQQQRVALARALVNRPRALLLDEPLGALDLKLRQAMQIELKRIQREVGITFVYVTHDQGEALTMSDRLAVMHDGRIEQLGSPRELYEQPANRFVAGFIGTSNVIEGQVAQVAEGEAVLAADADEHVVVPLRRAVRPGDRIAATIRPEKMRIAPGRLGDVCALRATVAEVVYLGTSTNYAVSTGLGELMVHQVNTGDERFTPARDDQVWICWPAHLGYQLVDASDQDAAQVAGDADAASDDTADHTKERAVR